MRCSAEIHTAVARPVGVAIDARRELQPVDLVVDQDLRNLLRADLREHRIDLRDVLVAARVARIHDVQQQRRLARLGERRLEGGDQLVRQLADEADRVGDHHRRAAGQPDAPHGRIERREQLVGDVRRRRRSSARNSVDLPALV